MDDNQTQLFAAVLVFLVLAIVANEALTNDARLIGLALAFGVLSVGVIRYGR